ncbi:hypothetical protein, partial [Bartonella sp. CL32QHWL-2]|uniref:hypothetical protein n=1 Tax=Bartonella sp. CL32QHWL-2 TaxID=3243525 RepID=UPI0035D0B3EE
PSLNLVNSSGQLVNSSDQLGLTKNQLGVTKNQQISNTSLPLANTSSNLVTPSGNLVTPSSNLVNSSGQLGQLGSTRVQLDSTRNQLGSTNSTSFVQDLSEIGQKAKQDLEILVATGKSKDFLNKQITFNDLDNMTEKEILKHHRMYETKMAARLNDSLGKTVLKTYTKLSKWLLPIDDEDDLYHDLRNDYLITNELDKWLGWFSIKMGPLTALASSTLITFSHC